MNNKFRVWCKNKNEWETDPVFMASNGSLQTLVDGRLQPLNPETHIVVFFTGRSDKNGVELYDGDILDGQYPHVKYLVEFENGEFRLIAYIKGVRWKDSNSPMNHNLPIIRGIKYKKSGTRFENPELLEQN